MTGLRIVLLLGGAFIAFTGLDVALGGIATSGWLGSQNFFEITSQERFLTQDNHVRFFGGLWFALGLFIAFASTNVTRFSQALNLALALIFVGGLARFSIMDPSVVFGPKIIGSLTAEIVGMPILAMWIRLVTRPT